MLKKWGVLLLGALAASAVLIVGANAVTVPVTTPSPSLDLSSRAAVMKYLASHGIDSKKIVIQRAWTTLNPATGKIVIQRGARNYAGLHCPGKGWTCTTSKHVVQISYAMNVTQFTCTPSTDGVSIAPNDCLIVQSSDGAANYAYCTQKIADPTGTQSCAVYQLNTNGVNYASVTQQIDAVVRRSAALQATVLAQGGLRGGV